MARNGDRPNNPDVLLRAVRKIFGGACLACGTTRPRPEMAHIRNWPTIRLAAESKLEGLPDRFAHIAEQHRHGLFHHLGNVVPLCPNHHTLFDGNYPELDEHKVRALRDAALCRPDVLARVIDFIRDELSGRPNRCVHKDENGRREHTRATDLMALVVPLSWVQSGFRLGLDLGDPQVVVDCASGTQHHHVALDQAVVDTCVGHSRQCMKAAAA
ncbi:HNH endonuclease [Streptomyces sp. NBC_00258]|uniref:HNH endonuclease n=1 Tax=Streptomyces sp. NBC_00258 TaxID=2903642 RepID=UPI002E2C04FE|nr:HNH endonuclease [Streptomyces sp. NBC_00258]